MTAPLPTPDEFRARLAEMTAAELAAAGRDPGVRACIEAGPGHAAVWREAVALHEALEAFDVPAPRVNVAARTMAAIAKDERARRSPSAQVLDVLALRVAVPAWVVAAAAVLLVASAAFNAVHLGEAEGAEDRVASSPQQTAPAPQVVVIGPGDEVPRVVQTAGAFASPLADPIPALVVIMGVPPSAEGLAAHPPRTIDTVSTRKESSI